MSDFVPPNALRFESAAPLAWVEVSPDPESIAPPGAEHVLVDVVHDGWFIPPEYTHDSSGAPLDLPELEQAFLRERDWGASVMAGLLASRLHLGGFHRIQLARVLLDFGRFPGCSEDETDLVHRLAINEPFSKALDWNQKRRLLEEQYDRVSDGMDAALKDAKLKIAIHTYDEHNLTQTRRPQVSLLSRSHGHQYNFSLPPGLFDPSFPAELVDSTADRRLIAQIALGLEAEGIYVAENYPYALPEGSVEVRSQVWSFFDWVRRRYDAAFPLSPRAAEDPQSPRKLVWRMLLDTNHRSSNSELLRSFLHHFRRPPVGREAVFGRARVEYEQIREFIMREQVELLSAYREERRSSLGLEIRKDLVWDFERQEPRWSQARKIAGVIADATAHYLRHAND